ncbi:MAG: ATP-binding protein [Spirochaetaceae bacterium]|nr:ATP-binding protein [Spirochaetaceae bacterium]
MLSSSLQDTVETQKREMHARLAERYIERDLGTPIRDDELIKVIIGPRRCGKSFLAMHLLGQRGSRGYVNFDDERLADVANYDHLIAAVNAVYDNPRNLLLDEIQNLPRWELFVNRLQRQGLRLILTGSNAHLLSSELATHLTGRHLPINLFPFSFPETLRADPGPRTGPEMATQFRRYSEAGGYPEPLLRDMNREYYLRTLWDSVLYKDIVRRRRIRSAAGLDDLAGYLLANVAREYSLNRLTSVTRCRSVHTVAKYIGHLEEAFLFFSLPRFSYRVRETAAANRKIYCIDNGFVTARAVQFSPDTGRLAENAVAVALHKRALDGACEVYFWKDARQREVDFVVKEGRQVTQLIQVCWDMTDGDTRQREIRALLQAGDDLSCDRLLVLTAEADSEEEVAWFGKRGRIRLLPLWRWFNEQGGT